MSDPRLVVDYAKLQDVVGQIGNAVTKMNTQLGQLESDAKPLITEWEGEAQQAYMQRQQQWRSSAEALTNMLTGIQKAVVSSMENFQGADKTAAGGFR